MKKLSVLFAILLMAFGFSSCEYHYEYPTTSKNTTINLDLHVNSADWQWSEQVGYYYYTFSVPELTNTICNKGIVVVYREFNKGTSDAYQINLPRIFPMTDSGNGEVYSQIIDFSYLPQQVEIAVTNSDLKSDLKTKPESMDFRLSMMY